MKDCFFSVWQIEVELRAQVKHFCELTGHLPSHMDGHQHVHVLPGNNNSSSSSWVVWITLIAYIMAQFSLNSMYLFLLYFFHRGARSVCTGSFWFRHPLHTGPSGAWFALLSFPTSKPQRILSAGWERCTPVCGSLSSPWYQVCEAIRRQEF